MEGTRWSNENRFTLVCVDSYDNLVLSGRIYHPQFGEGRTFRSLTDFFRQMETLLDGMRIPQSFTAERSFSQSMPSKEAVYINTPRRGGKVATFQVQIIFRQNASWQGRVKWLEGKREERFRSALELAMLMDSALCPELAGVKVGD